MLSSPLSVPRFTRLDEYAGVWAMEDRAFKAMWSLAQRINLSAHLLVERPPLKAQVEKVAAKGGKSIAIIKVMGTLMKQQTSLGEGSSTVQLRREIRLAARDSDVAAILLAIDSPGGVVAGTADLAAEVRAAQRAKPVWAYVDDMTASAAYWVASQAERIYANDATALVGSIGTLMTVYDFSDMAEQKGIKTLVFSTGPLKGAGVEGAPITEEQAEYFQGIVNAAQQSFDAAVQRGRKLTDRQLEAVKSGAVFPAQDAERRKLLDGIQSMDQTLEALAQAAAGRRAVRAFLTQRIRA